MKLIVLILLILYLNNIQTRENFIEPLEYIFYEKKLDIENNITGTGNKLKDVAYRALCFTLKCPSTCCDGPIDHLKCADEGTCNMYKEAALKLRSVKIILLVLTPYLLLAILFGFKKFMEIKYPEKYKGWKRIFKIYFGIIFPPYGICLLINLIQKKNLDDSVDYEKSSKMFDNMSVLFGKKEFEIKNFKDPNWDNNKDEIMSLDNENAINDFATLENKISENLDDI